MILNSDAPLTPRTAPKVRTGPLCARGVLAFEAAVRPHLADMSVSRLPLDDLLQVFCCRLSSFCCFCCLSVVYLLICYHFREIRGKQNSPRESSKNHAFFRLLFLMPFVAYFQFVERFGPPFGVHFGIIFRIFCIPFPGIDFVSICHAFSGAQNL